MQITYAFLSFLAIGAQSAPSSEGVSLLLARDDYSPCIHAAFEGDCLKKSSCNGLNPKCLCSASGYQPCVTEYVYAHCPEDCNTAEEIKCKTCNRCDRDPRCPK